MARLTRPALLAMFALAFGGLIAAGCGSAPADPPEPQASVADSNAAASAWTPEQKAAFQKAIAADAVTAGKQPQGKK